MDTNLSVTAALNAVMRDVQSISKDRRVQEGPARFNFRGVDDVVNAVGPALREHGVIVAPRAISLDIERYETRKGAQMKNATVLMGWTVTGPDGSQLAEIATYGEAADAGDKAVSKAQSVAYRTCLLQLLCIPTDEPDPDQNVHERAPQGQQQLQRPAAPVWDPATVEGWVADWRDDVKLSTTAEQLKPIWAAMVDAHRKGMIDNALRGGLEITWKARAKEIADQRPAAPVDDEAPF